jgi:hypothetical protein
VKLPVIAFITYGQHLRVPIIPKCKLDNFFGVILISLESFKSAKWKPCFCSQTMLQGARRNIHNIQRYNCMYTNHTFLWTIWTFDESGSRFHEVDIHIRYEAWCDMRGALQYLWLTITHNDSNLLTMTQIAQWLKFTHNDSSLLAIRYVH